MGGTFSQIYLQAVFAVKGRENKILPQFEEEVYSYISGIISKNDQKSLAVNGMPDHIHIFVGLKPSMRMSDLVREIKCNSTNFINEKKWLNQKFSWQTGYGVFSYSRSHIGKVIEYIKNQKEHHRKKTFKQEYIEFLKKFQIQFKDEYLFEFYD